MSGPPSSGSLAPALLRGHAAIGHPWPGAASAASMPRCPLRNACARPSKVAPCGVCDIAARHTMIAPTRSVRNDQAFLFAFDLHPRQPRHHKTRLGCRPNAGDAEWAARHGCCVSRPRPWMADGGVPTERRRSEGTRRSRAKPGARPFGYFWGRLPKVTRRKGGTKTTAHTDNGYTHDHKGARHSAIAAFGASSAPRRTAHTPQRNPSFCATDCLSRLHTSSRKSLS
jgi:hypothetical protein